MYHLLTVQQINILINKKITGLEKARHFRVHFQNPINKSQEERHLIMLSYTSECLQMHSIVFLGYEELIFTSTSAVP